jgi:Rad3-related DNA helicase
MFCDVIVCDYNYVFDPRIKLARFFNEDSFRNVFLIDEAHNLPSRSNEMYSASLSSSILNKMSIHEQLFTDGLRKIIKALSDYFLRVSEFIKTDLSTFDKKIDKQILKKLTLSEPRGRKPQELIDHKCGILVSEARPVLDRSIVMIQGSHSWICFLKYAL